MVEHFRSYTRRNLKNSKFRNYFDALSITNILIAINVLFFVIVYGFVLINLEFMNYIALKPSDILQGKNIWTLLTSMFMHGGLIHLLVNMFVLFSLGNFCEKVIGRKRFVWFYIISGLFAGIAFVILSGFFGNTDLGARIFGSPNLSGVGASGAIFAIAALFMILTPNLKFSIIFLPFFSLPAYIMIPLVLFMTWLISAGADWSIGNTAHFGGFLAGIFYGLYLKKKYSKKVKMLNQMVQQ